MVLLILFFLHWFSFSAQRYQYQNNPSLQDSSIYTQEDLDDNDNPSPHPIRSGRSLSASNDLKPVIYGVIVVNKSQKLLLNKFNMCAQEVPVLYCNSYKKKDGTDGCVIVAQRPYINIDKSMSYESLFLDVLVESFFQNGFCRAIVDFSEQFNAQCLAFKLIKNGIFNLQVGISPPVKGIKRVRVQKPCSFGIFIFILRSKPAFLAALRFMFLWSSYRNNIKNGICALAAFLFQGKKINPELFQQLSTDHLIETIFTQDIMKMDPNLFEEYIKKINLFFTQDVVNRIRKTTATGEEWADEFIKQNPEQVLVPPQNPGHGSDSPQIKKLFGIIKWSYLLIPFQIFNIYSVFSHFYHSGLRLPVGFSRRLFFGLKLSLSTISAALFMKGLFQKYKTKP